MGRPGKRYRKSAEAVDRDRVYSLTEAVDLIKAGGETKFDESVDIAISLGTSDTCLAVSRSCGLPEELTVGFLLLSREIRARRMLVHCFGSRLVLYYVVFLFRARPPRVLGARCPASRPHKRHGADPRLAEPRERRGMPSCAPPPVTGRRRHSEIDVS